jgi:hypothetical protein
MYYYSDDHTREVLGCFSGSFLWRMIITMFLDLVEFKCDIFLVRNMPNKLALDFQIYCRISVPLCSSLNHITTAFEFGRVSKIWLQVPARLIMLCSSLTVPLVVLRLLSPRMARPVSTLSPCVHSRREQMLCCYNEVYLQFFIIMFFRVTFSCVVPSV